MTPRTSHEFVGCDSPCSEKKGGESLKKGETSKVQWNNAVSQYVVLWYWSSRGQSCHKQICKESMGQGGLVNGWQVLQFKTRPISSLHNFFTFQYHTILLGIEWYHPKSLCYIGGTFETWNSPEAEVHPNLTIYWVKWADQHRNIGTMIWFEYYRLWVIWGRRFRIRQPLVMKFELREGHSTTPYKLASLQYPQPILDSLFKPILIHDHHRSTFQTKNWSSKEPSDLSSLVP